MVHVDWFRVVPEKLQSEKWHLITDMSFPEEESVNDTVDIISLCSLKYITIEQMAKRAMLLGIVSLKAKMDTKAAY